MGQNLVSIGKAADILGVHVDTLRQWDKEGKLIPVKTLGNHRRYKLEDVENIIKYKDKSKFKVAFSDDGFNFYIPKSTWEIYKNKTLNDLLNITIENK
jgi:excisionase family DNA binding protein